MQVTQGKSAEFAEGEILLDVYDASTGVFPFITGNGSADFRQPAALVTRSSSDSIRSSATPANNNSFYNNASAWISAASSKLSVPGQIQPATSSNQQVGLITASWLNWQLGFDPQADTFGLTNAATYYHKLRWESVVRCLTTGGEFLHGWHNGQATDPYNLVGGNVLGIMARRLAGSSSFTEVYIRNNITTGAGSVFSVPITPVECVAAFVNIRWEVTLGPTFRIELFFNDVLRWASNNAGLAMVLTSATTSQMTMQAGMYGKGAAAPAGFVGPIASRATIFRVS